MQIEIGKPHEGQQQRTEDMVAATGVNEGSTAITRGSSANNDSSDGGRHSGSVSVPTEAGEGIVVGGMTKELADSSDVASAVDMGSDGRLASSLPRVVVQSDSGAESAQKSKRGEDGGLAKELPGTSDSMSVVEVGSDGGSVSLSLSPLPPSAVHSDSGGESPQKSRREEDGSGGDSTRKSRRGEDGGSGSERSEQQRARRRLRSSRQKNAARPTKGGDDGDGSAPLSPPLSPTVSVRGGEERVGLVGESGGVRRTEGGGGAANVEGIDEGSPMLSPVSLSSSIAVSDPPSGEENGRIEAARRAGRDADTEEASTGRRARPPRLDV